MRTIALETNVNVRFADGSVYSGIIIGYEDRSVQGKFNPRTRRFVMQTERRYMVRFEWENGAFRERSFAQDEVTLA